MDKNSNAYVLVFATTVCVVLATALAATYNSLKTQINANLLFDKQRNVLIACGLYKMEEGKTQAELEAMFKAKVTVKVIEFTESMVEKKIRVAAVTRTDQVKQITSAKETDIAITELAKARREDPKRILGEVYIAEKDGETVYCIPISGYGLWSTLYGFLALKQDRNTVVGITFYKHGETPGLGGEVEKAWWQNNWKDRKTHNAAGELVGITVLKGKGNDLSDRPHEVDGISGATITSNGVTKFVLADLTKYEVYFEGL